MKLTFKRVPHIAFGFGWNVYFYDGDKWFPIFEIHFARWFGILSFAPKS